MSLFHFGTRLLWKTVFPPTLFMYKQIHLTQQPIIFFAVSIACIVLEQRDL